MNRVRNDSTDTEIITDSSIIGQILDQMKSKFNNSPPPTDIDDPPTEECTKLTSAHDIENNQSPLRSTEVCQETEIPLSKEVVIDMNADNSQVAEEVVESLVDVAKDHDTIDNQEQTLVGTEIHEPASVPSPSPENSEELCNNTIQDTGETTKDVAMEIPKETAKTSCKSLARVSKKSPRINKSILRDSHEATKLSKVVSPILGKDTSRRNTIETTDEIVHGRRSLRNKSINGLCEISQPMLGLKRSSRRLSKDCGESVLQNAIARKEKSYNETAKPQRLSRRLKPTAKILANLEMCAKTSNFKSTRLNKDNVNHGIKNKLIDETEDVAKIEITSNGSVNVESTINKTNTLILEESDNKVPAIIDKTKSKTNKTIKIDNKKLKLDLLNELSNSEVSEAASIAVSTVSSDANDCDNGSIRSKSFSSTSSSSETRRSYKKRKIYDEDKEQQSDVVPVVVGRRRSHRRPPSPTPAEPPTKQQPVQPEVPAAGNLVMVIKRTCVCTKRTRFHMDTANEKGVSFCTAVDSIDGRGMGCNNLICSTLARRPSPRVPYFLLCAVHLQRLLRHNCCPACGMFCTQGQFKMCSYGHQYHRNCLNNLNEISIMPDSCYHCGKEEDQFNVIIKMRCATKPAFLPFQRLHYPAAKMSINLKKNGYRNKENGYSVPSMSLNIIESPTLEKMRLVNGQVFTSEEFYEAAERGDFTKVMGIVASGFEIKQSFDAHDGDTALHAACAGGHLSVVNILLTAGASIDVLNSSQKTPLMVAIIARHDHIVNFLVKNRSSITFKGPDGMTALHLAAKIGYKTGCEILVQATNADKTFIDEKDDGGWTPLVWACEHAHIKVAKYLLWRGADAHIRDLEQNVPLHWAAFGGSHEIIEMLLEQGCDVNAINVHKDSPLHIAARLDRFDCVVVLLAHKACPDVKNTDGDSPLDCCGKTDRTVSCRNAISLNMQLRSLIPTTANYKNPILTNDVSKGKEMNPVQCVNYMDNEEIPTDFVYVIENCITSDIVVDRKITTLQACTCNDKCGTNNCQCNNISLRCWYDDKERLLSDFDYLDPPMIFECNQACACNTITCNNRVVQRGLTQRFQLFRTATKGWGIRTLRFIQRGTYVCEYIGEIITDMEADQREDDSYLFDLDSRVCNLGSGLVKKEGETYCIDARRYGNLARFINHHCSPNLLPVRVFIDHQDLHFPRIAFFANRDIAADEELGFDYGEKFWIIKYKSFTCTCGAPNCRYSSTTIQSTLDAYKLKVSQEESGLPVNVEI